MKRCPQCHQIYADETLEFCRVDGMPLQVNSAFPTESSATLILPAARTSEALPTQLLQSEIAQAKETTSPIEAARSTQTRKLKAAGEIERHKRGIAVVLSVLILAAVSLSYWLFIHRSSFSLSNPTPIESIAVLPFENGSGDANLDYLSDGVSEGVIDRLSQLPQLKVIARSSSFQYRGQNLNLKEIADALGVQAIVTGRVVRRGDSYIIRVDVTDVRENKQLWGENFNRKVSDVQILQTDISREIADNLRLHLSGTQSQQLAGQGTVNPRAYELLLKGRFYYNQHGSRENIYKAVEYWEQAVAVDPNYALAYAELAGGYGSRGGRGLDRNQRETKREAAARRALELDANLAEAHIALASIKLDRWEWQEAEREYRRAIELNPNLPRAHNGYASYLSLMSRHDEAIAEVKHAGQVDPMGFPVSANAGLIFFRARRYDEAMESLKKLLELDQASPAAHKQLGDVYEVKGMYPEAIAEYQEAIRLRGGNSPNPEAHLGAIYVKTGERAKAEQILQKLRMSGSDAPQGDVPLLPAALGMRDEAFALLEKAYAERAPDLPHIAVEPYYDSLRSDPRFHGLLQRMGLTP